MRILIIDDEDDLRRIAEVTLAMLGGHSVLVASGGEAGLALAKSELPDAILLDLMMPGMDGLTTLQHLQADVTTAGIPVIIFTAQGLSDTVALKRAGAVAVLSKPFEPEALAEAVQAIV
ncbi:MAG: response regulator [Candidatus Sericytochromatia bacterium]|nr:response regulator [Candidatus Sericytochromatia bacterium]